MGLLVQFVYGLRYSVEINHIVYVFMQLVKGRLTAQNC